MVLTLNHKSRRAWCAAALCVAFATGLLGCGLQCAPPEGRDASRDGTSEEGERAEEPPVLSGEIALVLPSAPNYAGEARLTPLDRRVVQLLSTLSPRPEYDPCLARAAGEYGRYVVPGGENDRLRLPSALQTAVLHRAGCTDGWVSSHFYFTSSQDDAGFLEHVQSIFREQPYGENVHVGVGRARARAPYAWTYVVFLADRHAVFEPLPREYAPGQTVEVGGILLGDLEHPDVLLLEPGGDVQSLQVVEWEGGRFEAKAKASDVVGEHWIEVLATGAMGPQVVALFPIYVGQQAPDAVKLEPVPDESEIRTAEAAERLMFRLVNEDRRRFGLPALQWSDAIARIARGHSADMRDNGFFAHVSPTRGALRDRFEAARFAAYSMGENISRNDLVFDAEAGLMQSLGHRANILNPKFTHLGIGVAIGTDAYGHRTLFFTQNFAVPQRKLTGLEAREEVYERLTEERRRHRLKPLTMDSDLQDIAARFARFADTADGGYSASELTRRVKAMLRERGYRYRAFYIQTHTVLDPSEVQLPAAANDAKVRYIGIGIFPSRDDSATVRWKTLMVLVQP